MIHNYMFASDISIYNTYGIGKMYRNCKEKIMITSAINKEARRI